MTDTPAPKDEMEGALLHFDSQLELLGDEPRNHHGGWNVSQVAMIEAQRASKRVATMLRALLSERELHKEIIPKEVYFSEGNFYSLRKCVAYRADYLEALDVTLDISEAKLLLATVDSLTAQLSSAKATIVDVARDKALDEAAKVCCDQVDSYQADVERFEKTEDPDIRRKFMARAEQGVTTANLLEHKIRALQSTPAHPDAQGKVTDA